MTVPGALPRLLAIVIFAAALPCRGEEAISGRWEGTTHIADDDLNVIVDLAQENGAWVGSIIIPGLDVKAPLTDIAVLCQLEVPPMLIKTRSSTGKRLVERPELRGFSQA